MEVPSVEHENIVFPVILSIKYMYVMLVSSIPFIEDKSESVKI